jgi:transposase
MPSRNGKYLTVSPVRQGVKQKPILVHRLVALTFLGEPPTPDHDVNHLNGNRVDNRPDNLAWATRSENIEHAYKTGLHLRYVGSKSSAAKLTEEQVSEILQRIAKREYRQTLADEFSISIKMIDEIVSGAHWKHVQRPDLSGKRTGRQKLTTGDVSEVRRMLAIGLKCGVIGKHFGVSAGTIRHIKDGRTWAHA